MREILFRGKQIDSGEWVEGFVIRWTDGSASIDSGSALFAQLAVDPETVGQYTGLKDKNGKRIFEGDVLKIAKALDGCGTYYIPPLDYPVNVVVKWDLCAWMWETLCKDKRYIGFPEAWGYYECEVIGNIHDNPELLEVIE